MKAERVRTVRELTIWAIHKGKTNAEALACILKLHPRSTITLATINYVRNQIRQTDKTVMSDRAAKRR